MANIQRHVARLTERLLTGLLDLQHSSGKPVVDLYGPADIQDRGGTVSFNVMTPNGTDDVASGLIEERANARNISLRTGCFCNPGAAESAFNYGAIKAYQCFDTITAQEFTLQQFSVCMNEMPVGAVRVSLGIASNEADVDAFLDFMRSFIDFEPDPGYRWRVPERVEGGA
jgi:molybdenum cofactor sulfurtransferase